MDKKKYVGGNLYCENIEEINIHKNGARIFHTNNEKYFIFKRRVIKYKGYKKIEQGLKI